uniref:Secreted protein n=1 Tax=Caenorhabditis japonica TaxID=281687 RepID=A0A8R1EM49_CAEJA
MYLFLLLLLLLILCSSSTAKLSFFQAMFLGHQSYIELRAQIPLNFLKILTPVGHLLIYSKNGHKLEQIARFHVAQV